MCMQIQACVPALCDTSILRFVGRMPPLAGKHGPPERRFCVQEMSKKIVVQGGVKKKRIKIALRGRVAVMSTCRTDDKAGEAERGHVRVCRRVTDSAAASQIYTWPGSLSPLLYFSLALRTVRKLIIIRDSPPKDPVSEARLN